MLCCRTIISCTKQLFCTSGRRLHCHIAKSYEILTYLSLVTLLKNWDVVWRYFLAPRSDTRKLRWWPSLRSLCSLKSFLPRAAHWAYVSNDLRLNQPPKNYCFHENSCLGSRVLDHRKKVTFARDSVKSHSPRGPTSFEATLAPSIENFFVIKQAGRGCLE